MERLSDTAIDIINRLHTERLDYNSEYVPLIDGAQRLAAYEDTGMEPEEIEKIKQDIEDGYMKSTARRYGIDVSRLSELAHADREGRCVVLNVKIGQSVWILDAGGYGDDEDVQLLEMEVDGITLSQEHETYYFVKHPLGIDIDPFSNAEIGKVVFLTREEAEAALEGMKK